MTVFCDSLCVVFCPKHVDLELKVLENSKKDVKEKIILNKLPEWYLEELFNEWQVFDSRIFIINEIKRIHQRNVESKNEVALKINEFLDVWEFVLDNSAEVPVWKLRPEFKEYCMEIDKEINSIFDSGFLYFKNKL